MVEINFFCVCRPQSKYQNICLFHIYTCSFINKPLLNKGTTIVKVQITVIFAKGDESEKIVIFLATMKARQRLFRAMNLGCHNIFILIY